MSGGNEAGISGFLDDLIDACVMECYFREHMAERDLLFLDELAPHLADYRPDALNRSNVTSLCGFTAS